MTQTTTCKREPLAHNQFYTVHAKSHKYPKAFGSFFGTGYFEHTKEYYTQYKQVCKLNKWNLSKFKSYTSMLRWLMSNNATQEVLEAVLDVAWCHSNYTAGESYSWDEIQFLSKYYFHKYIDNNAEPFDCKHLPKKSDSTYCNEF